MAGNPDGSAELEQKLVSGVVFLLLGDAERGVLGNVVFDVDVAFELFKAGNISIKSLRLYTFGVSLCRE